MRITEEILKGFLTVTVELQGRKSMCRNPASSSIQMRETNSKAAVSDALVCPFWGEDMRHWALRKKGC